MQIQNFIFLFLLYFYVPENLVLLLSTRLKTNITYSLAQTQLIFSLSFLVENKKPARVGQALIGQITTSLFVLDFLIFDWDQLGQDTLCLLHSLFIFLYLYICYFNIPFEVQSLWMLIAQKLFFFYRKQKNKTISKQLANSYHLLLL